MTYTLWVSFPFSRKTEDLVNWICAPTRQVGAGTHLPTNTRELRFTFTLALEAARVKAELEKEIPDIRVEIEINEQHQHPHSAVSGQE